ncbi:MAG: helix-turn-helix transcriptional regulator [Chloroflexi bacterium]|nr:helix-turn-helix transcriptional regulator [Chloroflexota bacterium]
MEVPTEMTELTADELMAVKVFRALGDPTRYRIVQLLTEREELGCGDLPGIFDLSAPALSHHTRTLLECGLLSMRREGAHHFFRLRREQVERFAPGLLARPAAAHEGA